MKCPGQDSRFWKPDSIFEIECPLCSEQVEFFKDDIKRECFNCGSIIKNPKFDPGCAAHCRYADKCFAGSAE